MDVCGIDDDSDVGKLYEKATDLFGRFSRQSEELSKIQDNLKNESIPEEERNKLKFQKRQEEMALERTIREHENVSRRIS